MRQEPDSRRFGQEQFDGTRRRRPFAQTTAGLGMSMCTIPTAKHGGIAFTRTAPAGPVQDAPISPARRDGAAKEPGRCCVKSTNCQRPVGTLANWFRSPEDGWYQRNPLRQLIIRMRFLILLAVLPLLAACGALPAAGPSTGAILSESRNSVPSFDVIPLTPQLADRLAANEFESFSSSFSGSGSPADLRIGIADTVVVTIFEAASCVLFSGE